MKNTDLELYLLSYDTPLIRFRLDRLPFAFTALGMGLLTLLYGIALGAYGHAILLPFLLFTLGIQVWYLNRITKYFDIEDAYWEMAKCQK